MSIFYLFSPHSNGCFKNSCVSYGVAKGNISTFFPPLFYPSGQNKALAELGQAIRITGGILLLPQAFSHRWAR